MVYVLQATREEIIKDLIGNRGFTKEKAEERADTIKSFHSCSGMLSRKNYRTCMAEEIKNFIEKE